MKTKSVLAIAAAVLLASCSTAGISAAGGGKPCPLDTCIVTGNTLGSMGDPVSIVHEGRQEKFCCSPCLKKFRANPARHLASL